MANPFRLPRFYPVLDTLFLQTRGCPPLTLAEILLDAGVQILQYRHKASWTQAEFDEASAIAALCQSVGATFVLNDRADYAHLLKAALHVGQNDLPPIAARRVVGADTVIGFSTHNRQQLLYSKDEPVHYVSLGPIFATTSKDKPDPVVGITQLQRLRPLTTQPLVAIGGATLANAPETIRAGADSVAVISGLLGTAFATGEARSIARQWIEITNSS